MTSASATEVNWDDVPRYMTDIWALYRTHYIRFIDFEGNTIILNKAGSAIWRLIDGERSLNEIIGAAQEMHLCHDGGHGELDRQEVQEFLLSLLARGWIGLQSNWATPFNA